MHSLITRAAEVQSYLIHRYIAKVLMLNDNFTYTSSGHKKNIFGKLKTAWVMTMKYHLCPEHSHMLTVFI